MVVALFEFVLANLRVDGDSSDGFEMLLEYIDAALLLDKREGFLTTPCVDNVGVGEREIVVGMTLDVSALVLVTKLALPLLILFSVKFIESDNFFVFLLFCNEFIWVLFIFRDRGTSCPCPFIICKLLLSNFISTCCAKPYLYVSEC